MGEESKKPVLIELEGQEAPNVADAPPIPDALPETTAMTRAVQIASRKSSAGLGWFGGAALSLLGFVVSLAAYDYLMALWQRSPILGGIATGLLGLFCAVLLGAALRELAAFARLARIDGFQSRAAEALSEADLPAARKLGADLGRFYRARPELAQGCDILAVRSPEIMDAEDILGLAERELLAPLDARAVAEIEAAARQVATITALVPLALADLIAALTANLRMIRRIAEIYGGRAGSLGSWRLTRTVFAHLVATGAVAVGDDLIGSVAGGGVLSKLSRRFGEGVINGALTARVGVAALEVCRPLPFDRAPRPSVSAILRRALTGLFGRSEG